jgi:hypothetical protein
MPSQPRVTRPPVAPASFQGRAAYLLDALVNVVKTIARDLSIREIEKIVAYYSILPPP